jgi:hypothetical protein
MGWIGLLLCVLLVGMTLGGLWHHHRGAADEANCSICHLNHQPIDRPTPVNETSAAALLGPTPEPAAPGYAPTPALERIPARAPPLA